MNFRAFSSSARRAMQIVPVPVRADNYAYLLIDEASKKAAAVDPFDVPTVVAAAERLGEYLVSNVSSCGDYYAHHLDHSGGNKRQDTALTKLVKDKDEFKIGDINIKCLATPCHTQDSICYHVTDAVGRKHPGGVFTGDTLFIGGCGRFFEGVGAEMDAALTYLGTLPDKTLVYNGHEYTQGNVAFGKTVEPENKAVGKLEELARTNEITTGMTTIGDEKEWNVFMRLGSTAVRNSVNATADTPTNEVMDALRAKKDNFRG
ncbi:hydroxyacylglutathione hydrolase [Rhodocollybia butyracea]|uniref:hydroxyacylglutathione hydrolase n=1 Tax=Rhodocollybia butyracea TaxID=206335 RepID=A0A9P5Q1G8_9AGAR|nr:hydroxyacylglutathione hydrolase [Rhodocollybia butyracea]